MLFRSKNLIKNIEKALSQLSGALRSIKSGKEITSLDMKLISLPIEFPPHCIVLVPELSLLSAEDNLGGDRLKDFLKTSGAFLHFLDPTELLRAVQVAMHQSSLGKETVPMLAFDSHLFKRWEHACQHNTPNIDVIAQFVD